MKATFCLSTKERNECLALLNYKYEIMNADEYITDGEFFEYIANEFSIFELKSFFSRALKRDVTTKFIESFFKKIGVPYRKNVSEKLIIENENNLMYLVEKRDLYKEMRIKFGKNAKLKEMVKDRDNHRCIHCGIHEKNATLEIHHIEPMVNFPEKAMDMENLATLCVNCHLEFHRIFGHGRTKNFGHEEFLMFNDGMC